MAYTLDSEGPTIIRSDGTTWTPAWGPGSLACGHIVETDNTVTDITGISVCIPCWNDNVRAKRRTPRR